METENRISELKERNRKIMSDFSTAMDSRPDYSLPEYEKYTMTEREKMFGGITQKIIKDAQDKLEKNLLAIRLKIKDLNSAIEKIKFPEFAKSLNDEILLTKLRAENIAFQKLDFNILDYIENAYRKNEIDFIFYLKDALKLNSNIANELMRDINIIFNRIESELGITEKINELNACNSLLRQTDIHKKITADNNPALKMELSYEDNEFFKLLNAE